MKCGRRRVADGTVLGVLKAWLEAPIVEQQGRSTIRTTPNKDHHRGTPQGGVISPLLANLYMRRFLLAWGISDATRPALSPTPTMSCCAVAPATPRRPARRLIGYSSDWG